MKGIAKEGVKEVESVRGNQMEMKFLFNILHPPLQSGDVVGPSETTMGRNSETRRRRGRKRGG
jgi:hypothetical protein